MKRFFKLMSIVFVFCILWIINVKSPKADFKISTPNKITIYLGDSKFINAKVFLDGEEFTSNDDLEDTFEGDHDSDIYIQSIKWKRSNKNISLDSYNTKDIEDIDLNMINPNKTGKTKITLTIKYKIIFHDEYDENGDLVMEGGWGYSDSITKNIWVTVKPYKSLRLGGNLYKYDTRSNIFKVELYNPTDKKIRIYSKGARSLDCDYTKYDRRLKLTKNRKYVDLKPGKWTKISFKVIGRTTWWDVDDEEVHCTCKYKNKKYTLSIETGRIMKWTKKGWKKISID